MVIDFNHPVLLFLLIPSVAGVVWLAWKSDVSLSRWRRWTAMVIRLVVLLALVFALAGMRWLRPAEGMSVFFLLDRSDSIPGPQQEAALRQVNQAVKAKEEKDLAGVLVFGSEAALEFTANPAVELRRINAVVGTEQTDIAAAIRLGSAAFPEHGQKRLLLITDGNETLGDAFAAVTSARALGVTLDILPQGAQRGGDVAFKKLALPQKIKEGQTFDAKLFIESDRTRSGTVRLYRNDQYLGEQQVELSAGKNLFSLPQTLDAPGFYNYRAELESEDDSVAQNNRSAGFVSVRGRPRILVVSADPVQDQPLVATLQSMEVDVQAVGISGFPETLAEMQSYDSIFISNVAAGDVGRENLRLLDSAIKDFGVGVVCVGGENAFTAGGYRGTPLDAFLPVNMELDSRKVLPNGAVALVMHGMEFNNGNAVARDCAIGVLDALGPQDEMGVILWDGVERWLFPMTKVGDKRELGSKVAGMNQGDLPSFQGVMSMAYAGLKASNANLKHMIVFSDGDPGAPSAQLMNEMVGDKITVTTVLIAGHAGPDTMQWIAENGRGRFYNITSPEQLPQIFIKEAAVILKSAIFEEPFVPRQIAASEIVRGLDPAAYPVLRGYVCTTPKNRAEVPLVSDKGDPILAHWQYGLGRTVAFTSDAKGKWASGWLGWERYRQFWTQAAQWSMRRLENADFSTEISIDKGEGHLAVEAVDANGNYRNFLDLRAIIVNPKGDRLPIRLEQKGPGRYEARFPVREVGSYLVNLMDLRDGQVRGTQVLGASMSYSPEFAASEPNSHLLKRLAEEGGGKLLDPANPKDNPFLHDREKTRQPEELWESLLKLAILLFVVDVGLRRIQIDREQWVKAWEALCRWATIGRGGRAGTSAAEESLAALLARRQQVRASHPVASSTPNPALFQTRSPVEETRPSAVMTSATPVAPPPSAAEGGTEAGAVSAGEAPAQPTSTTSKLLDAKRRARKKLE